MSDVYFKMKRTPRRSYSTNDEQLLCIIDDYIPSDVFHHRFDDYSDNNNDMSGRVDNRFYDGRMIDEVSTILDKKECNSSTLGRQQHISIKC